MTIRQQSEALEHSLLCDWATFSDRSLGREQPIAPCPMERFFGREAQTMTIRQQSEALEHSLLCDWATFSDRSLGREQPIAPCPIRTCFARDRDRIIHSKAFRRLSNFFRPVAWSGTAHCALSHPHLFCP